VSKEKRKIPERKKMPEKKAALPSEKIFRRLTRVLSATAVRSSGDRSFASTI
jgi:hypothetical protein